MRAKYDEGRVQRRRLKYLLHYVICIRIIHNVYKGIIGIFYINVYIYIISLKLQSSYKGKGRTKRDVTY